MSMNLTCEEVVLYQTPTQITWWCFGMRPHDLFEVSVETRDLVRKLLWYSQKGRRQIEVKAGRYAPFVGSDAKPVLERYLKFILEGNHEIRRTVRGKEYTYINPNVYGHIKHLLRQPVLTLGMQ